MKKGLLGYYDYTVILTYCGAVLAVGGICQAVNCRFLESIRLLLLAGFCDMFDGAVARTKARTASEKRFGVQIDSLCDLISFGVLPGVFTYQYLHQSIAGLAAAVFLVLCALIRLAFFNVQEEERQNLTDRERDSFQGLPVTSDAVILPLVFVICERQGRCAPWLFPLVMAATSVCFLLKIEIRKPKLPGKVLLIVLGAAELAALWPLGGGGLL